MSEVVESPKTCLYCKKEIGQFNWRSMEAGGVIAYWHGECFILGLNQVVEVAKAAGKGK